jgi:hypothetical protein
MIASPQLWRSSAAITGNFDMSDNWVKVIISDGHEIYGKLVTEDFLSKITTNQKAPLFFELQKTAKLEWARDEKTGEALPSIVPTSPPGSSGAFFLRTEAIQSIALIPENSNLTKSLMSHYSGIRLTSTMPAGIMPGPTNKSPLLS